jgi:hypothetical protein
MLPPSPDGTYMEGIRMSHRPYLSAGVGILLLALFLSSAISVQAADPYTWKAGPSNDPNWFPIAVWDQWYTGRAQEWAGVGVNMFVGGSSPTSGDQSKLTQYHQKAVLGSYDGNFLGSNLVIGWNQMDEPDNAQSDGHGGYGPCVDPNVIIARYNTMKAADPNRPVFLGLGQGVCYPWNSPYIGRGSGSNWAQYQQYVKGGDIIDFDVYPYNDVGQSPYQNPWYIATGIDRLKMWTNNAKPIWMTIETDAISGGGIMPKPYQTKGEVWIALVHGAAGIQFFSQCWYPNGTWNREDGTFSPDPNFVDPNMPGALKTLTAQIQSYAPLLYSTTVGGFQDPNFNVNNMDKVSGFTTTVFSVAMRDANNLTGSVTLSNMPGSLTATVLEEGRTVPVVNGVITDDYSKLALHIYQLSMPEAATTWTGAAGNWMDPNRWSQGDPNVGIRAIVSNGSTATINSAGLAAPLYVILGLTASQSGTINMTAGSLHSSVAYIGYDGRGTFTQSGGAHAIDGNLYLGQTHGSVGLYNLSDGNLTVAGTEYVGYAGNGVFTQTGGKHTVSGPLYVGYASDANATYTLAGGKLIAPSLTVGAKGVLNFSGGLLLKSATDANLLDSITSSGLIDVTSGTEYLSSIVCPDANILTGIVRVEANATLWVSNLLQGQIYVSGTLVLGTPPAGTLAGLAVASDYAPDSQLQTVPDPALETVPEPCALALLGLGGLTLLRRRRRR